MQGCESTYSGDAGSCVEAVALDMALLSPEFEEVGHTCLGRDEIAMAMVLNLPERLSPRTVITDSAVRLATQP